jgi:hypothetical protein
MSQSSKYKGVYWAGYANKWRARIWVNKEMKHLGYFDDEYEAHLRVEEEKECISKDK